VVVPSEMTRYIEGEAKRFPTDAKLWLRVHYG
jgi:hypothetical protein